MKKDTDKNKHEIKGLQTALNKLEDSMDKLKKETDKRYVYSEEQWKNVLQERWLMGQRI